MLSSIDPFIWFHIIIYLYIVQNTTNCTNSHVHICPKNDVQTTAKNGIMFPFAIGTRFHLNSFWYGNRQYNVKKRMDQLDASTLLHSIIKFICLRSFHLSILYHILTLAIESPFLNHVLFGFCENCKWLYVLYVRWGSFMCLSHFHLSPPPSPLRFSGEELNSCEYYYTLCIRNMLGWLDRWYSHRQHNVKCIMVSGQKCHHNTAVVITFRKWNWTWKWYSRDSFCAISIFASSIFSPYKCVSKKNVHCPHIVRMENEIQNLCFNVRLSKAQMDVNA